MPHISCARLVRPEKLKIKTSMMIFFTGSRSG